MDKTIPSSVPHLLEQNRKSSSKEQSVKVVANVVIMVTVINCDVPFVSKLVVDATKPQPTFEESQQFQHEDSRDVVGVMGYVLY